MASISEGIFQFPTKWNLPELMAVLETAKEWFNGREEILDIGCGRGESTAFLNATGLELREFETWKFFPKNKFFVYDGRNFPFADRSFDAVLLNNVFEHVKNKKEFVLELERISKVDAVFVFILPTPKWKLIHLLLFPKHMVSWLRGYGFGNAYWFVHEPEVYGLNYLRELWDFSRWEKIVGKHFKIADKKTRRNGQQLMLKCIKR